ncbi:DUF2530 domain-containing protein [Streptomyces sp. BK239]|uniref:DUF2530 domain-containing protein n=1 Tax=Streptomyces sp. BK239 TaxID=2512155 RepID=UPI00102B9AAA|nr:DUF2530 domain-containing protein [Streptomyces sp. BK239]RZU15023.1 uncharacterized protein DUF2530 [Streptomyces sp. BK239]
MAPFLTGSPRHEAPEPLEGPVVGTVTGGTVIWFVLFLAQLPFYGWYEDHGHLWWLWTCLAGAGLGLIGIWYVRKRDAAIKREAARAGDAADAARTGNAAHGGDATDASHTGDAADTAGLRGADARPSDNP